MLKTVPLIKASFMLTGTFYFVLSMCVHRVPVKMIFMFVQFLSDTLFNFITFSGASRFYEDTDFSFTIIFLDCALRLLHIENVKLICLSRISPCCWFVWKTLSWLYADSCYQHGC